MKEFVFGQSSLLIVSGIFLCMLLAMEIGLRLGRRGRATTTDSVKSQVNAALASMLGLLALLLGFTFSLALHRYDDRSQYVVAEANAIGSTYLSSQLLPAGARDEAQDLLRQYLDLRIQEGHVSLAETAKRESLMLQENQMALEIWGRAMNAMEQDPRPISTGLFVQSVNRLIEARNSRNAALNRHVPEIALLLLFATFVLTAATLGYASGIAGHRVTPPAFISVVLIMIVVYLIIDLDRPRRGFVRVPQDSMLGLRQTIAVTEEHRTQSGSPADTLRVRGR